VAAALKYGQITRPERCEACRRETTPIAHHPNYERPLEVMWLCDSCHHLLHKGHQEIEARWRNNNPAAAMALDNAKKDAQPRGDNI
jgi:hypothetical protein